MVVVALLSVDLLSVVLVVNCIYFTEGERKCHYRMVTKSPRRPDGDLNGSWEPNGDQNKPFWTPLGHHGHLGRHHQVVKAIWSWHLRSP